MGFLQVLGYHETLTQACGMFCPARAEKERAAVHRERIKRRKRRNKDKKTELAPPFPPHLGENSMIGQNIPSQPAANTSVAPGSCPKHDPKNPSSSLRLHPGHGSPMPPPTTLIITSSSWKKTHRKRSSAGKDTNEHSHVF